MQISMMDCRVSYRWSRQLKWKRHLESASTTGYATALVLEILDQFQVFAAFAA